MSEERALLLKLEAEQKFVFHGSGLKLTELEPNQAFQFLNNQNTPDGAPAIFGSSFCDYAIFMALINRENCHKGYRAGVSYYEGRLLFRASAETLNQLDEATSGYVYVFDRSLFKQRDNSEWICYVKAKPLEMTPVKRTDFVQEIKVIEPSFILP